MEEQNWISLPKRNKKGSRIDRNMEIVSTAIESRTNYARAIHDHVLSQEGNSAQFYEYLDHTADIQLHAWGNSIEEAFTHVLECMFNYITDISRIEESKSCDIRVAVSGHDIKTLLFNFLHECLVIFSTECFVFKSVRITNFSDQEGNFSLSAIGVGEPFDLTKHVQGTEVKAITYSAMQILKDSDGKIDIYVIVDI